MNNNNILKKKLKINIFLCTYSAHCIEWVLTGILYLDIKGHIRQRIYLCRFKCILQKPMPMTVMLSRLRKPQHN